MPNQIFGTLLLVAWLVAQVVTAEYVALVLSIVAIVAGGSAYFIVKNFKDDLKGIVESQNKLAKDLAETARKVNKKIKSV